MPTNRPTCPKPTPAEEADEEDEVSSGSRYRTQRRGGKGLRDIKTTDRNGPVIGVVSVRDDDEMLMMTARGKLQRIVAGEISVIGRNTQGVRIMSLDEGDTLAAIVPRAARGIAKASEHWPKRESDRSRLRRGCARRRTSGRRSSPRPATPRDRAGTT